MVNIDFNIIDFNIISIIIYMDELLNKDYYELYDLYDQSTDESEKKMIQLAVEQKSINETDPDFQDDQEFQPYPERSENKFQDIIYKKKEFHSNQLFLDNTRIENSCNSDYSIKPHQNFLKNFVTKESPYKSLLIYHGVGVGKTCSGLTIAENFRDMYARKDKRILILCSKNIQIGWKKTIYDPEKGISQCTGDAFIDTEAKTGREVNKLVKQYYEIMAYQSFSNYVKRMISQYVQRLPLEDREQGRIQCIKDYFSDRLLIIDEVHNIRDEQGSEMRDAVKTIEQVITYSDNLRLVLLTATPMYNRSTEILWILNMMLLNDKKPTIHKKDVFDSDGELTGQGSSILERVSQGYISYLRGENPITFPLRLYPHHLKHKQGQRVFPYYNKNKQISIINKLHKPSLNLVGGKIQDKFKFLELLGSKLQGLQNIVYMQAIKNLIENTPDLNIDVRGDMNPILDNIMLTQITDIVYPIEQDKLEENIKSGDITLDDLYGTTGLKNCMNKRGNKYSYKKKVLDKYGPIFDKDLLPNFSSKIATIIDLVDNSEGIVFIYTNFIDSGITPLQLSLEQNGYKKHTGEIHLQYPEFKSSSKQYTCKREPLSYDGLPKSKVEDKFQQGKFMVIDGSTNKKTLQEQLKIVSSKENSQGQKIKVILGTVVASEGLDFKRIRSIHILDPWLHLNRIEQTVGRGIRFCSHADLKDEDKNVITYLHTATLSNDRESIDTSIYRYAEKKSLHIGEIENILKKTAVDRYLYKDVNVINQGDLNTIVVKPSLTNSELVKVDPSDKKYSKICSYMPECDYNKGLSIDYEPSINEDTFMSHYSKNILQTIKKKISLLFKEFCVYDINSILGLMSEYGFNYDEMILQSLSEMLLNKHVIYDKQGNSGYMINAGKYYIFQPFLYEDRYMPLYYRQHLLHKKKDHITLDRLNEVEDTPTCSKIYSLGSIQKVYNSLDTLLETYEDETTLPDTVSVMSELTDIYPDLTATSISVSGYLFDRLQFNDRCAILYGYIHKLKFEETNHYGSMIPLLDGYLIYQSESGSTVDYYFNKEKQGKLFGFYVSYNNKPYFYEYFEGEFVECNQIQGQQLQKSLKRYISTKHYKDFKRNTKLWGYTIMRKKGKDRECVLKFAHPGVKQNVKYPPGPGNVCIENNIGSRIELLKELLHEHYPELDELIEDPLLNNKKNMTFLLEIILRHSLYTKGQNSFYSHNTMWLKYM